VDIHPTERQRVIKFMRQNLGLAGPGEIRDRNFEIGVDLAKERA